MRPVTPAEWRDAAGGVGCWCDSHELEICGRRRHAEPCQCRCHVRPDLRVVAGAPQETSMPKQEPTVPDLVDLIAAAPPPYFPENACPDCRLTDDHAGWCSRGRRLGRDGEQAAAHHIGSVHATDPGEA